MIAEKIETDFLPNRTATTGTRLESPPRPEVREPRTAPRRDNRVVVRPKTGERTRPMGHRGPLVVRQVRALGWRSPETLAVLVASFCVSLASIYVAAYARVEADGAEEAKLIHASHVAEQQKDELLARISELSLASTVQRTASQMNMVPDDPKNEQLVGDTTPVTSTVPIAPTAPSTVALTQP